MATVYIHMTRIVTEVEDLQSETSLAPKHDVKSVVTDQVLNEKLRNGQMVENSPAWPPPSRITDDTVGRGGDRTNVSQPIVLRSGLQLYPVNQNLNQHVDDNGQNEFNFSFDESGSLILPNGTTLFPTAFASFYLPRPVWVRSSGPSEAGRRWTRICVTGGDFGLEESLLLRIFSQYGKVESLKLVFSERGGSQNPKYVLCYPNITLIIYSQAWFCSVLLGG